LRLRAELVRPPPELLLRALLARPLLARPPLEADRPRLDAALLRLALDLDRDDPALLRLEDPLRLEALLRVEALPPLDERPREELALLPDELAVRRPEPELPRAASARLRTALPASLAALPASLAPLAAVVAASRTPLAAVPALLAADSALFAAEPAVRLACLRFFCACFTCRVAAAFLPRDEAVLLDCVRVVCLRCRVAAAFLPAALRLALDRDFACAKAVRLPSRFRAPADALPPSPLNGEARNRETQSIGGSGVPCTRSPSGSSAHS
jgi:hypothetical protein